MSKHKRPDSITYADACEQLQVLLTGNSRAAIVDDVVGNRGHEGASQRLCRAMRAHHFPTAGAPVSLRRVVDSLNARSQREGLYVLHPWDVAAQSHPRDIAPVLMAAYCERLGLPPDRNRATAALLLDHYLLTILALLAVRAWDAGDPNENLDAVTRLIGELHGPNGSGQTFVLNAETLLLLAVSYYHPAEECYARLLGRVRLLDHAHQLAIGLAGSALLGAHLRWGLRFMYRRDVAVMRADNVVDYPWLAFGVLTCLRAYGQPGATEQAHTATVVDALLNGISADPFAFQNVLPSVIAPALSEHAELRELLGQHRSELVQAFALLKPSAEEYSPLGFACNFPLNVMVGTVACSLIDQTSYPSLNALFTRAGDHADHYARRLMQYAVGDRSRLEVTGAPLIVYDPYEGRRLFDRVMRVFDPVRLSAG